MALRIAFDLDGVLANMEAELVRQAESLFGDAMTRRLEERAVETSPSASAADTPSGTAERQAAAEASPENVPPLLKLNMTARQQRRLWKHVESIENFWQTLEELEPGVIDRLSTIGLRIVSMSSSIPKRAPFWSGVRTRNNCRPPHAVSASAS